MQPPQRGGNSSGLGQSEWQMPSNTSSASNTASAGANSNSGPFNNQPKIKAPLIGGVLDNEELKQADPNTTVGAMPNQAAQMPISSNGMNAMPSAGMGMGTGMTGGMGGIGGLNPAALLGGGMGGGNGMGDLSTQIVPAVMMLMQAMPPGGIQLPRFGQPARTYVQSGGSGGGAAAAGRRVGNQVGNTVGRAMRQAAQQGMSRAMSH